MSEMIVCRNDDCQGTDFTLHIYHYNKIVAICDGCLREFNILTVSRNLRRKAKNKPTINKIDEESL